MSEVRAAAAAWTLDPSVTFLNHGSFGACPTPVLDDQARWRARMEADPVQFLEREIDGHLAGARERVAAFLRAEPAGLVFVTNTTTAVSTVLASLRLRPGDEIVTTDHAYPAVLNALARFCEGSGATLRVVRLPLPIDDPAVVTTAIEAALTPATRLVVADHVTSITALVLPVAGIVASCRARDVPVLVDAAHGPGMLDVDVAALGADYWCGNLHKWVCAPKGSAAMWVAPVHRDRVRPLVVSHSHLESFHAVFDWTGTHDPTPFLAAPAALDFFDAIGWEHVRAHNAALAEHGRAVVAAAIRAPRIAPPAMHASMTVVPLPDGVAATRPEAVALARRLFDEHRIQAPVNALAGRGLLRLSAMPYNTEADYDRLASALASLI